MKFYKRLTLEEDLKLSDLTKHAGVSDLTKKFMKDRLSTLGGKKSGTLLKINVKESDDYIDFDFVSKPTYADEEHMITNPSASMELTPSSEYDQTIRITNFFSLLKTDPNFISYKEVTLDQIKAVVRNADVKLWCDCPSQIFQGHNFYLTQFNGSIHPTTIAPQVWNKLHKEDNLVCKHLDLILSQISFYSNPMSSMILKYLRKKR